MTEPTSLVDRNGPQQDLIGISISESPDFDRVGFGQEHLHELMGSVARTVLRLPGRETALVYGGDVRPGRFTRYLFDVVANERTDSTNARPVPPRRLYNYLAWPHYTELSKTDEAQMINICHFLRVTPRHAGFDQAPDSPRENEQKAPRALVASRCLTRMRELSTYGGHPDFDGLPAPPLRARVLLGGKTHGYSSIMPGLFEEFLIVREPGPNGRPSLPVYLIGAFGGAAGQLAAALLDAEKTTPLRLDHQCEQDKSNPERNEGRSRPAPPHLEGLLELYAQHFPSEDFVPGRYRALAQCTQTLGSAIRSDSKNRLDNGLTPEENRALLQSRDEVEIRRLIQKGLTAIDS